MESNLKSDNFFNYETDLRYDNLSYRIMEHVSIKTLSQWLNGEALIFEGALAVSGICPICEAQMTAGNSFCSMCVEHLENNTHYDTQEANQKRLHDYDGYCNLVLFYPKDYIFENKKLPSADNLTEDYLECAKWIVGDNQI